MNRKIEDNTKTNHTTSDVISCALFPVEAPSSPYDTEMNGNDIRKINEKTISMKEYLVLLEVKAVDLFLSLLLRNLCLMICSSILKPPVCSLAIPELISTEAS